MNGKRGLFMLCMICVWHLPAMMLEGDRTQKLIKDIFKACKEGDLVQTVYLITEGANIHARDRKGVTLLHVACLRGHLRIVKLLVQNHVAINVKTIRGHFTPLHCAVFSQKVDLVSYLLTLNVDLYTLTAEGDTAFKIAYCRRDTAITELFAQKWSIDQDEKEWFGDDSGEGLGNNSIIKLI